MGTNIVDLLSTRRMLRGSRRNRKKHYRQSSFPNRKKPEGWVALSVLNKIDNQIKAINMVHAIPPITKVVV